MFLQEVRNKMAVAVLSKAKQLTNEKIFFTELMLSEVNAFRMIN